MKDDSHCLPFPVSFSAPVIVALEPSLIHSVTRWRAKCWLLPYGPPPSLNSAVHHGMRTTEKDRVNTDLLAFING